MASADELLTRKDVEELLGIKKSALYAYMRKGDFPAPLQLSAKCVRWKRSEVEKWIASRPRATGEHPAPVSAA